MKIRGDSSNDVPIKLQEALEYMPQAIGYASGYQLGLRLSAMPQAIS